MGTCSDRLLSIDKIVTGGLCIGCGLCQSVAGAERIHMVTTPEGRERPVALKPLPREILATINAVCPGTRIEGAVPESLADDVAIDPIWGPAAPSTLMIAHASDPVVRHQAAAGGVLTALGQHLLRSGEVELVLHVKTAPDAPLRSVATVSTSPEAVFEAAASRYGPAAVFENFDAVLDRGRPLAVIAKPCDIGAIRRLCAVDPRANELVRYGLALVCGGASDLGKSLDVLDALGVAEHELRLFRYRGHGNPGPTRVETKDGAASSSPIRRCGATRRAGASNHAARFVPTRLAKPLIWLPPIAGPVAHRRVRTKASTRFLPAPNPVCGSCNAPSPRVP